MKPLQASVTEFNDTHFISYSHFFWSTSQFLRETWQTLNA